MKIVKYTLGIIAGLVIIFLALGLITPEVSYECEITVDKPLPEAWAVAQDEDKMSEWLVGFQKIEAVSGTPGTVGAVSDVYFNNEGEEMVIRETIISLVHNKSMNMSFNADFMDMDYSLSIAIVGGKTTFTSQTTTVGNGIMAKSIMAMMSGSIKAQEDSNLSLLKATIENNTKVY